MMTNKQLFYNWIVEREKVRLNKETGMQPPYTDDIVLQTVRFTNINRENDKVTKYIRSRVKSDKYLYVNLTVCRLINYIPYLDNIEFMNDSNAGNFFVQLEAAILTNKARYGKYLGNAYLVTNGRNYTHPVYYSILRAVRLVHSNSELLLAAKTCKEVFDIITDIHMIGSFIGNQIVQDAKNTVGSNIYNAADKFTFTSHGQGSLRGINVYFEKKITAKHFMTHLAQVYSETCAELHDRKDILEQLDYHNIQNCLCEYSKYMMNINLNVCDRNPSGRSRTKQLYNKDFEL